MIAGLVDGCASCQNLAAMDRQQSDFARAIVEPWVQEHVATHRREPEAASPIAEAVEDVSTADAASGPSSASSDLQDVVTDGYGRAVRSVVERSERRGAGLPDPEVWRYRRTRRDGPWLDGVRHVALYMAKGFAGTDYVYTRCGSHLALGGPEHTAGALVTFLPVYPEDRQTRVPCQRCYRP